MNQIDSIGHIKWSTFKQPGAPQDALWPWLRLVRSSLALVIATLIISVISNRWRQITGPAVIRNGYANSLPDLEQIDDLYKARRSKKDGHPSYKRPHKKIPLATCIMVFCFCFSTRPQLGLSVWSGRMMALLFVLTSANCFSIFQLCTLWPYLLFSRSNVKSSHLSFSISARLSHKQNYRSEEWPTRKCGGLFCPRWSQLVAGTIFSFVLIDHIDNFSRSVVKARNLYWSGFTQTNLQVRRSIWNGDVTALFPPWSQLVACIISFCTHWSNGSFFKVNGSIDSRT